MSTCHNFLIQQHLHCSLTAVETVPPVLVSPYHVLECFCITCCASTLAMRSARKTEKKNYPVPTLSSRHLSSSTIRYMGHFPQSALNLATLRRRAHAYGIVHISPFTVQNKFSTDDQSNFDSIAFHISHRQLHVMGFLCGRYVICVD